MVALLDLSKQLFTRCNSSSCRNLSVRQLLIIVSDGRGVFHEGREKVLQSVMKARQATSGRLATSGDFDVAS